MGDLNVQIIKAYRSLYKQALIAVKYSQPSRTILRDRLRRGFRKGNASDFDPYRIDNTIQFLRGAAWNHTLEHKVLISLCHVWREQDLTRKLHLQMLRANQSKKEDDLRISAMAYDQFNHLIRMLNESMGMCLK